MVSRKSMDLLVRVADCSKFERMLQLLLQANAEARCMALKAETLESLERLIDLVATLAAMSQGLLTEERIKFEKDLELISAVFNSLLRHAFLKTGHIHEISEWSKVLDAYPARGVSFLPLQVRLDLRVRINRIRSIRRENLETPDLKEARQGSIIRYLTRLGYVEKVYNFELGVKLLLVSDLATGEVGCIYITPTHLYSGKETDKFYGQERGQTIHGFDESGMGAHISFERDLKTGFAFLGLAREGAEPVDYQIWLRQFPAEYEIVHTPES